MAAFATVYFDGADSSSTFDLISLEAREYLGQVYRFSFAVLSNKADFTPRQLLGKSFGVRFSLQDGIARWFNGIILQMGRGRRQGHRHEYWLEVQPDFALLGYRSDARIFQNKSVTDVFGAVVSRLPALSWQFRNGSLTHRPWEYCVQYQESDLDFALRLLEQEGIYFLFDHADNAQTRMLLLDDNAVSHQISQPVSTFTFNTNAAEADRPQDYIDTWSRDSSLVSGMSELGDFDFKRPIEAREARSSNRCGHACDDLDLYFYPGEFDTTDEGRTYADIRMQAVRARHAVFSGSTVAPGIHIGRVIHVKGHPVADMNGDFLVTGTDYKLVNHALDAGASEGAAVECRFTCIPDDVQFRPERITKKSTVFGPQTAFVVGPENDEIHTDEYGRIRVQFHWDRYGKPTEDTSCWIRTAQPWANQGFGFWALPRVGSEVVVQFLDGDPDRPIVIGSVYNGENRIPYPQPGSKTQSGLRTYSTPKGGANDYNELRFEDKKGGEELYVQAQKDMNTRVKADATRTVGGHDRLSVKASQNIRIDEDRSLTVDKSQKTSIKGDRQISVGGNEYSITEGDRAARVGSDSLQVQGDALYQALGSMGVTTGQSYALKSQLAIALSAQTAIDIKSGLTVAINATSGMTISCGASYISLTPAGIFIQGPLVSLNTGGPSLSAQSANPAKAQDVQRVAEADAIAIADSPPVKPATQQPRAGSLSDAARTGAPFASAG